MQFVGLNKVIDILPGAVQDFRSVYRVNDPFGGKGSEIIRRQGDAPAHIVKHGIRDTQIFAPLNPIPAGLNLNTSKIVRAL